MNNGIHFVEKRILACYETPDGNSTFLVGSPSERGFGILVELDEGPDSEEPL